MLEKVQELSKHSCGLTATLTAGQYVQTPEGECIHLTLGDDKADEKMMHTIGAHLYKKWRENVGNEPDFG